MRLELIAVTPTGLESVVAQELEDLGIKDRMVENGRVTYRGNWQVLAQSNLWLRSADRILIKLAEFHARTFEELFVGVSKIPWTDWIPSGAQFPVSGRSFDSQLESVPACQKIVKKAIVEAVKKRDGGDWVDESSDITLAVEVSLFKNRATITLDSTGAGLHKRGYRTLTGEAPLKETMAHALVHLSGWTAEHPLIDPFCGSGTILIEAALKAWNVAPGLKREFLAEKWPIVPSDIWNDAREEAFELINDRKELRLVGYDINPEAIQLAEAAVKSAGIRGAIRFENKPAAKMRITGDNGFIITNPPYGERIGEQKDIDKALRELGAHLDRFDDWNLFVISNHKWLEHQIGRKADKLRKLFNGRIACHFFQFYALEPKTPAKFDGNLSNR